MFDTLPEARLLPAQRQLHLASILAETDAVALDTLARRFGVSTQTIRRDLDALERQGLVRRTFGGAITREALHLSEPAFVAREQEQAEAKGVIARAALAHLRSGESLFIDASTTALALARLLPDDWEGDVVVTALPAAMEMARRPRVRLMVVGGEFRHSSRSFSGTLAEEALQRLCVATALISARAVHPQRGLMEAHAGEATLKRIVLTHANRVLALVDSSKLGGTALHYVAPLTSVSVLITDSHAPTEALAALRALCAVEVAVSGRAPLE